MAPMPVKMMLYFLWSGCRWVGTSSGFQPMYRRPEGLVQAPASELAGSTCTGIALSHRRKLAPQARMPWQPPAGWFDRFSKATGSSQGTQPWSSMGNQP